ncbi:hypothetical protein Golax_024162, partial [Gossypium laxum]|nr:hypothetical protein [Gossypium laxum]
FSQGVLTVVYFLACEGVDPNSEKVIRTNAENNFQGFETWAVGKIMAKEKSNREAMYRVFKSLWLTKEEVNFVALNNGAIIVKFRCLEDRSRILNIMPWLLDNCLFAMMPFIKGKDIDTYEFKMSLFWLRDRNGGWTKFLRLKIKINVSNPLRRIVKLVERDAIEIICVLKYERLPVFCYSCGLIGHTTTKCKNKDGASESNVLNLQYRSLMRVNIVVSNQDRGIWRNGVEIVSTKTLSNEDKEESQIDIRDDSGQLLQLGRFKSKRKRQRGLNGDHTDESPSKIVMRRLLDNVSPCKVAAGDQPRQEQ